jgi:hypothetical protein
MLRKLKKANLLPLMDSKKASKEGVLFILIDAAQLQKQMSLQATSSYLFTIPCSNEEMNFCRYPSSGDQVELGKLKKWCSSKNQLGPAVGNFKHRGDDFVSPEMSQDNSPIAAVDESRDFQVANESVDDDYTQRLITKNGWNMWLLQIESSQL